MEPSSWLISAIRSQADVSWHDLLFCAAATLPHSYVDFLNTTAWLPGKDKIFRAFSLPLSKTRYLLYGESPYPRAASANGFAFWDAAVGPLWADQRLSKTVNRATSLRNFLKMLLREKKSAGKEHYVQTLDALFQHFLDHGFLLLNFNLSLSNLSKTKEAKYWIPFHEKLLEGIQEHLRPLPQLILLGKIAERITQLPASQSFPCFMAEHPYNLSFIESTKVQEFFWPLKLLEA